MFFVSWKRLAILLGAANLVLIFEIYLLITNECSQMFISYMPVIPRTGEILEQKLTVLVVETETDSQALPSFIGSFCRLYPRIKLVVVFEETPYPPIKLSDGFCNVKFVITQEDAAKNWKQNDPLSFINTSYLLVVPDSIEIDEKMNLEDLNFSRIGKNKVSLISVMTNFSPSLYDCIHLNWDIRKWTLSYERAKDLSKDCNLYTGQFAYFMKKSVLESLNIPFVQPFAESISIQGVLKNLKFILDEDLRFFSATREGKNPQNLLTMDSLKKWRLSQFYRRLRIKKVINIDKKVEYHGCTKMSPRCFPSIVNNTPNYLLEGKWTPPCCLENLRVTSRRVFHVLDGCKVRYWLEGGSLLGAARNGDIIPWDFDVDLGMYEEDIEKCPLLSFAKKQPVKDEYGFVWEKAEEGEFFRVQFSETNRLHVDIFPFYPINGIMTKRTWFRDHPQDKEFPESFVKKLIKVPFAGVQAYAPENFREFLEFKFGQGAIEKPEYPNPKMFKYSSEKH